MLTRIFRQSDTSFMSLLAEMRVGRVSDANLAVLNNCKRPLKPTDGIEPTSHGQPVYNVFRADVVRPGLDHERVLANAPARIEDEFKVPRIME